MKRVLVVLFIMSLVFCLNAGDLKSIKDIKSMDISQYSEDNGRVLKGIPRPDLGTNFYVAHVEFGHINDPVLLLSQELTDRDAVIEIRAHNFPAGLVKRHMIKVKPGQKVILEMKELTEDYNVLQFCSLEPFNASIRSQRDKATLPVKRQDLLYNPSPLSEEEKLELERLAEVKDRSSLNAWECWGIWRLECATPATCGTYTTSDWGHVVPSGFNCREVYWKTHSHLSCGTNMSTTVNSNGDYGYWWHYGDCPWNCSNDNGEWYSVYIYFPI